MSAPLYLVDSGGLAGLSAGDAYLLTGTEGRHAGTVKRARMGESIDVSDGDGLRLSCIVENVSGGDVSVRVQAVVREPVPAVRLVLAQALAKGDRDERAIEAATELGVDEVIPWQADRSVVVWRGDRAAKSLWRWKATVREAAKQSRRASVPAVHEPLDSRGLAELIGQVAAAGGCGVVLHEEAQAPLDSLPLPAAGDVLLVVGPEGGITAGELAAFAAAGAHPVVLGPHVLRTSTAGPAALAALSLLTRRW